jgi:uncharacterized low-complexity protein
VIRRFLVVSALALSLFAGATAASASASHPTFATPECAAGYYKNIDGKCVRRPGHDPRGATAKCRDGTYSYSKHASGTCSHHGGVRRWIRHP